MILSATDERPHANGSSGRVGGPWRRRILLIAPALAIFGISLPLPAVRVTMFGDGSGGYDPGYAAAVWAELLFLEFGQRLLNSSAAGQPSLKEAWPYLAGATANHLFALTCLAVLLGRFGLAAAIAGFSTAAAFGCLLPLPLFGSDPKLHPGPGYFVWCAASVVLFAAAWHARRRARCHPIRTS